VKVNVETWKYPPGEQLYRDIGMDRFYNRHPTALVLEADTCFITYNVVRAEAAIGLNDLACCPSAGRRPAR
jgi:hypothetical protein